LDAFKDLLDFIGFHGFLIFDVVTNVQPGSSFSLPSLISNIQSSMKRFGGGGISKLFVPIKPKNPKVAARYCQPDGSVSNLDLISMAQADKTSVDYATILDSEEIEHHLLTYNWNWFRQAKDTPFGQGELYELVGYDGLTEAANYIVDGDCMPSLLYLDRCPMMSIISELVVVSTSSGFYEDCRFFLAFCAFHNIDASSLCSFPPIRDFHSLNGVSVY
jgi:hypothetical protein